MGLVIKTGDQPRVRFLDGRECIVSSNTLTVIPQWMFDDEVLNRQAWENYLNRRVYQVDEPTMAFLPSPRFDLLQAMVQTSLVGQHAGVEALTVT